MRPINGGLSCIMKLSENPYFMASVTNFYFAFFFITGLDSNLNRIRWNIWNGIGIACNSDWIRLVHGINSVRWFFMAHSWIPFVSVYLLIRHFIFYMVAKGFSVSIQLRTQFIHLLSIKSWTSDIKSSLAVLWRDKAMNP